MTPRAVLFDLDNTLVHRARSIESYAAQFLGDFKNRLANVSHSTVLTTILEQDNGGYLDPSSGFNSIIEAISFGLFSKLPWRKQASSEELQAHWVTYISTHTIEMPGASKLIDFIGSRNIHIGVISNGGHLSRLERVRSLPFGHKIEALVSSERVGIKKPDSRIFKIAADELGIDTSECWYVGDHPVNDIVGAQGAGMRAIWLRGFHDWPAGEIQPQFSVHSLSEVIRLIDAI